MTSAMVGTPKGSGVSSHNREKQSLEYLILFSIKLTGLEIYHEQVFNLLTKEKDRTLLAV